nr:DUF2187 family protein [Bacillus cereus]
MIRLYSLNFIPYVSGGTFEFERTIVNHKNYKILNTNT